MDPQDLVAQLERTRSLLETLTDEVERNTEILHRSQERELELLQAQDLGGLFRYMLRGLADSYRLDANSVVLWDPDHDVRHLLLSGASMSQELAGLNLVDTLAGLTPHYAALEQPWLGPYAAADHQHILSARGDIRSIAIIPLRREGRLLGSLNFGSADRNRFTQEHATDFFAHLGVIASFALENTVNRARLLRSGFTDVLTGWYNRRYLQVRIKEELARARRDRKALACLMLDVDHFKRINDSYGHAAGDRVLQVVAERIDSRIRATDVAARYGGEEFVILLPDTGSRAAVKLADRIRREVAATDVSIDEDNDVAVTASIGIASETPDRDAADLKNLADSLIARADAALYEAKSAGRNRVVVDGSS